MPRSPRIRQFEFPYSVTTRCNNQNFYLQKQYAYRVFEEVFRKLKNMRESKESTRLKYQFEIHHLEVMSNHYHLVLAVSEQTSIDRLMQQINSMVARALNKAIGRTGHFWGGRYKSRILNSLQYLKKTIAYVYRNPIKAKVTKDLLHYSRSTLNFYLRNSLPEWLTPDPFLRTIPPPGWRIVLEDLILKYAI
ncbi:MAG: transposase IS200-like protein [Bacteriovoracaceae bacterium]|nr:transposase IS200-like protein [Bacteriovoracaceae bacterium]